MKILRKIEKSDRKILLAITIVWLVLIVFTVGFDYVYGSNTDWFQQHITFPEYFRNLFYNTGNILPDFAPHLGGGQNIYYFSYYGLLNPIILFSYLLPFVPMPIYIMISTSLAVLVAAYLFSYFLKLNKFSTNTRLWTSLLFLCSSSLILHSHRHIMFVSYMPFLILALIGVYRYFEKKGSLLLVLSTFLIIMVSYYYSIGSLITICLYGIYYYFKVTNNVKIKSIIIDGLKFLSRLGLGILLSSLLLFPVIFTTVIGRVSSSSLALGLEMFIPQIRLTEVVYGTYGIGATSVVLIALYHTILKRGKSNKFIGVFLLILISLPIINYILNGFLYLNGKVFIPLLPIFMLLVADLFRDIKSLNNKNIIFLLVFSLLVTLVLIPISTGDRVLLLYFDLLFSFGVLYLYRKINKDYLLVLLVLVGFVTCLINSTNDKLVTVDDYNEKRDYFNYDVEDYINKDTKTIYRYQDDLTAKEGMNYSYAGKDYRTTLYSSTANTNYSQVFYNTFNNNNFYRNYLMLSQTDNLFFQTFMGVRYLLTSNEPPVLYSKIKEYDKAVLYENKNVKPIGYSSTHILSKDDYDKIKFPYNLEAFNNNIIVNGNSENSINTDYISKIDLDYSVTNKKNIEIEKKNNKYYINSKKKGEMTLSLDDPILEPIIIRFYMDKVESCDNGDTIININGVINKLTCKQWRYYNDNRTFDYVLSSSEGINELKMEFSRGEYEIKDIEIYEINTDLFKEEQDTIPLDVDFDKTKGDKLFGNINQIEDGYFIFTISYDEGFRIYLDDKLVNYEMVNDGFIGFPITNGKHSIRLEFVAPYSSLGQIVSCASFCSLVLLVIYEKKKRVK